MWVLIWIVHCVDIFKHRWDGQLQQQQQQKKAKNSKKLKNNVSNTKLSLYCIELIE